MSKHNTAAPAEPTITVSACGRKVRIEWPDGMEESAPIPEFNREHVLRAMEYPDFETGRDGMTNKDVALLLCGLN